jgi:glycosyltransferase involved in cell wall biosynthesis
MLRVLFTYDVVHMWAHFYLSNFLFCLFSFIGRAKLIMTLDTIAGLSFKSGEPYDSLFIWYYRLLGWIIWRAPKTITLYGSSLIEFANAAGIDEKKTVVIPTGMDMHKFDCSEADIRRELQIKDSEVMLLFMGILVPRKGVDILIKTLKQLKHRQFRMVLVGDGPSRQGFEKQARSLKDKVIFTGFRKDVGRFLKSADVLFFPSRGEGLAGVIMEAESVGLPIVSSRIPCTIDLVKEGKNGFLCDIEDTACYAKALDRLIEDKELRARLGKASKAHILKFSWEDSLKEIKKLY